jgi:hypothetical protein
MTAIDMTLPTYSRGLRSVVATATRVAGATVTCDACGCRLTTRESADDAGVTDSRSWFHFGGSAGRDARGCAVACVDAAHHIG